MKASTIKISKEQLKLPVAFNEQDIPITLKEVLKEVAHISWGSLSENQRAKLTSLRISAQPKFEIQIGMEKINKERAINEVNALSKIGLQLIEIEGRVIHSLTN